LLGLFSLNSAEAYIGRGRKLNGRWMARCIKNYHNLIIGFQVTVENIGATFLGHSVKTGTYDRKRHLSMKT